MRTAVIGHVEWIDFVRVARLPASGDIVHATDAWQEPGGGGPVSAVRLEQLTGDTTFFTALGDDELGHRALGELQKLGLRVETTFRPTAQRRAITSIDEAGRRTITVIGERLGPNDDDPLAWELLEQMDAVYATACKPAVLRRARRARVLVATSRMLPTIAEARVELDALVGSASDPSEGYERGDLDPAPALVVRTEAARGGRFWLGDGPEQRFDPAPLQGPMVDDYGCGDSFAAGLTYGLGASMSAEDAIGFAARCGVAALSGRGAFGALLEP